MWIALEGNIGVGKTTLISRLADYMGWRHLDERVEQDPKFQELLGRYYKDNSVSYELQTWLTGRRFNDIMGLNPRDRVLVERSIFGDIVFTHVNWQQGNISDAGYEQYSEYAAKCIDQMELPKIIIYLDAPPNICYTRTMNRNRECEEGITRDYLFQLDESYKKVLFPLAEEEGIPIVQIDYTNFQPLDEIVKQCWLQTLI